MELRKREYTLLQTHIPISNTQITEFEEEEKKTKKSQNWTDKWKEKLGNFVYKVNHSGSYLGQYNKLDYKNCDKKEIKLMCGHKFQKSKCKEEVQKVFKNIILFTYRKDFVSPLESINKKSGKPKMLSSDFGWGCMIRWGQMMLANSILMHIKRTIFSHERTVVTKLEDFENNEFSMGDDNITEKEVYENIEKEVISKFLDSKFGEQAPFSIHEITNQGLNWFHKVAGDWYGPNSISQVLRELNHKFKPYQDFEIWVFNHGVFFKDEVLNLGSSVISQLSSEELKNLESQNSLDNVQIEDYFKETRHGGNQSGNGEDFKKDEENKSDHSGGGSFKSQSKHPNRENMDDWQKARDIFVYKDHKRKWDKWVLVIVNTMLGPKKIPEEAHEQILNIFDIKQMIGIIGGRGKFGLYFVGAQKDNLILLDPHLNQETVANEDEIVQNRDTYRWKYVRTIKIKKVDPWIGIGFLIRSYSDFQSLTKKIEELNKSPHSLFGIQETHIKPKKVDIDWRNHSPRDK
jgi:hypothetical protein